MRRASVFLLILIVTLPRVLSLPTIAARCWTSLKSIEDRRRGWGRWRHPGSEDNGRHRTQMPPEVGLAMTHTIAKPFQEYPEMAVFLALVRCGV